MTLKAFFFALCGILVAALTGCQTAPQSFPQPTAEWRTSSGQMRYVSAEGKSIIGDLVVSRSKTGDLQLSFSSGPGFPLMRLSASSDRLRLEGVLARGSWQGAKGSVPARLRGWSTLADRFGKGGGGSFEVSAPSGERFTVRLGS